MSDEVKPTLRCGWCDEQAITLVRCAGQTESLAIECKHRNACERAYRLGTDDTLEAMQDEF